MTDSRVDALLDARLHEPHALLGVHAETAGFVARHFDPHATRVGLRTASTVEPMIRVANGLFEWRGPVRPPAPLTLRVEYGESPAVELRSPYAFEPEISADDLYLFNDEDDDILWDAVWNVAAQQDSAGWTAEFRIPLSQLRYNAGAERPWGINFAREIARHGEEAFWSPTPLRRAVVAVYHHALSTEEETILGTITTTSQALLLAFSNALSTLFAFIPT